MDVLQKWHGYFVDIHSLFAHWEERRRSGIVVNRKDREIAAVCFFSLCLEYTEKKRFLVGFPALGTPLPGVVVKDLFDPTFAEVDDWDAILVPDLGTGNWGDREFHQCQIVGYTRRKNSGTQDLIQFLEEKKLSRNAGGDLKLIVHLEQPTEFDWVKISIHLQLRQPRCPFDQVFVLAQVLKDNQPAWICHLVFPKAATFGPISQEEARVLLRDRPTSIKPHGI
jgi:hypothetical protein